ncbi:hypothetical protein [Virgibacillus sp. L01]|uniref:hypothetical protein n=1 Tax=Virgibacillus sp. L01 TaxID=3457429 RepID=UPI003FD68248
MEKRPIEKVAEFAQSESKAKQFRHDYPIPDEMRQVLLTEEFRDFTWYVLERNFTEYSLMLQEFIDEHCPDSEKRQVLEMNLFWWQVLYHSSQDVSESCVEDYIAENAHRLNDKPLITSWLREWDKAVPKFYYVGYKYNDRVLVLIDMLTTKTIDVMVYDPTAVPPKTGEIVMGTLIPIGDALYFPIIDFYHFDYASRKEIAVTFDHHHKNHMKDATIYEAFIHVLSVLLQIERIVPMKN